MIELKNWRVLMEVRDRELGYESDHLHRRLEIAVDLDAGWAVKLDMALGKAKNVVDLERTGDVLWVDLTRDILASDGLYRCQLLQIFHGYRTRLLPPAKGIVCRVPFAANL